MKKKLVSVVLVLAMLVTVLAGCSSSEKKNDTTPTKPAEQGGQTEEPTDAPKLDPVTLKLGLPGGYDVTSKEIIDGFIAAYPEITVEIDEAPWGDFTKKITTQIAGGNAPDIWFQENAAVLGYGAMGAAEDLTPYIARDLNTADYSSALFSAQDGDKVWGAPHGGNPIALAYNKDLFDEAGIPYPTDSWTYEDMINAAKELTKDKDGDGTTDVYGMITGFGITDGWFPWIKSAGGQALDETKTKAVFNDEKSLKGITEWFNTVNTYKVSPSRAAMNELGGSAQLFGNGMGAMMFLQYSQGATVLNVNFPDLNYDTVKIPSGFDGSPRVVPNICNSWIIYSKAKAENKEAAWTFLKYYLSYEAQKIVGSSGSTLPVNNQALAELDNTGTNPLNKRAYTEGVDEAGVTMDENKCWNEWRTAAQPTFNDIVDGNIDAATGLNDIHNNVQKVLDDNFN
ncbi:multiple sugar transport system substrate-binding protein [Anaerotaenia torta]|uniref:ABC transporter substrate-binding protein n=1 Tax=Anaerotaenia torta TaxID=433293 RepID=UPI003D1A55C7